MSNDEFMAYNIGQSVYDLKKYKKRKKKNLFTVIFIIQLLIFHIIYVLDMKQ